MPVLTMAHNPEPASRGELYTAPIPEIYRVLNSTPGGLTQAEAAARLRQFGPNTLREIKGKPLIVTFLANFTHVMALLLWVGGLIGFIAQMPQLGIAIWSVNLINGIFSFWQEYKAERATEALRRLLPTYARVLRDGVEQRVLSENLVPGDVLLLAEGDHISADGRVIEAAELRVDQSTLTGESRPVPKTSETLNGSSLARAEIPNLVFAGTNVAAGTGKALVFATGMRSAFGAIAQLTQSVADEPSPLQRELGRVTRAVTVLAVGVGMIFFLLSVLAAGVNLAESFIFAMGMIVAFVPEGMLPTVTLSLAMGVQRMAKRHALVKRLSAVETLGCTSVICTDKTGTLTENEMTVRNLWVAGRQFEVTGAGYAPQGEILEAGRPIATPPEGDLRCLLVAAALCNDARLLSPEMGQNRAPSIEHRSSAAGSVPGSPSDTGRWEILGDPTEAALLVVARKAGIDLEAEAHAAPRVRELPFESRRKRMSTIHSVCRNMDFEEAEPAPHMQRATHTANRIVYVKGAPKEVLALCRSILINGRPCPLGDDLRAQITEANDEYAGGGLRVLAVAMRFLDCDAPSAIHKLSEVDVERDLTFLGLQAMMDPPRPEVAQAVAQCRQAGIRIIMITGDYGLTAASIARRIGIVRDMSARAVTGVELDAMDETALRTTLQEEVIFARVAPEHKLRIVSALQSLGQVVAVTGDGVNDAPALKKADIGVAMGIAGTDVAKEAADMILTDDNFASIVNAIEEGRTVYANIKKFITYIFTSNMPEAVPFILFALSQGRIPLALTVMQILAVDLGTDMVPALALGAEPPEPGMMNRPPRRLSEHVITGALLARSLLWLGLIQSLVVMIAFYFQFWRNGYWGQWLNLPASGWIYQSATAMALAAVVMTQVGNLFAQRAERTSIIHLNLFGNRLIWIGIAIELALIGAIVYLPGLQGIFGTAPFDPLNWIFLLAWMPTLLFADELRKWWLRR